MNTIPEVNEKSALTTHKSGFDLRNYIQAAQQSSLGFCPGATQSENEKLMQADNLFQQMDETKNVTYETGKTLRVMPTANTISKIQVQVGSVTLTFETLAKKQKVTEGDPNIVEFLRAIGCEKDISEEKMHYQQVINWDSGFSGGILLGKRKFDLFFGNKQTEHVPQCHYLWAGLGEQKGVMCQATLKSVEDIPLNLQTTLLGVPDVEDLILLGILNFPTYLGTFFIISAIPTFYLPDTLAEYAVKFITTKGDQVKEHVIQAGDFKIIPFEEVTNFGFNREKFVVTEAGKELSSSMKKYFRLVQAFCTKYKQGEPVPSNIFNVAMGYANQIIVLSRFVITDENLEFSYLYNATSVHMRGNVQTMIEAARILGNALKNINASEDLKEKAKQRISLVEAILQHINVNV